MIDLTLPLSIRTLTNAESERLKAQHSPADLPPSPAFCITCKGTRKFRWWDEPGSPARMSVEYECPCDNQWILHRALLNAGIGLNYMRLGWADMEWAEPAAVDVVENYLNNADAYVTNGFGLFLYGSKGAGKTSLGTLLLKALLGQGRDCYFTTFNEMLTMFTAGWTDVDSQAWFHRRIKNAGVLAIDDPGKEMKGRIALPEALLDEVIRHRVAALRPTFVMSNLTLPQFEERYGTYVMSLLHERATTHRFEAEDVRVQGKTRNRLHDEIEQGLTRPVVLG